MVAAGLVVALAVLVAVLVGTTALDHLDVVVEHRLRAPSPGAGAGAIVPRAYARALSVAELGDGQVLATIAILVTAAAALARRRWRAAWCSALVLALLVGAVEGGKRLLGRQPPLTATTDPHLFDVGGLSFPSGHSSGTLVVFGLVAALLSGPAGIRPSPTAHAVLTGVAGVLSATVGICTIVLGWHWPTDVLGGWLLGAILLILANLLLAGRSIRRPSEVAGTLATP